MRRRDFLATAGALPLAASAAPDKPRLPRKDCFFGLHFDLHPNKEDRTLGRDLTAEMAGRLLDRAKPDYIQYDCKGHPGYMGYPSKVSTPSPGIVKDSLAIWRQATRERGVGLYIHFSGVWDSLAVEQHPEWAKVGADGTIDKNQTSTFGPYVDERMIPQLKEASANYDLDGAWVDGECWATAPDFSTAAAAAFRKETGRPNLPRDAKDPDWNRFLEFNRQRFREYVRHYLDELHRARPKFQIASNWLYSTFVPERPDLPVDFVSGDYLGDACIERARLEARYLSAIGKPWDLMAWGFQWGQRSPVGFIHKTPEQIQQEACVVLTQGGGFQVYFVPTRASYFDDKLVDVMEAVARFCRARQVICHKAETVPQIGLLFSKHSLYSTSGKLFGGWPAKLTDPANGVLAALVESQLPVDVIPDWRLGEVASKYPMIVVPEWPDLGMEAKQQLVEYTRSGGQLLLTGAENTRLFYEELGIRLAGEAKDQEAYVPARHLFANTRGVWQDVEVEAGRTWEQRYPAVDFRKEGKCAASWNTLGTGRIAAIHGPVGGVFAITHMPGTRDLIARTVRRMFTPMVEVKAPSTVEVVVKRKDGRLLIHLNNATGMQVANHFAAPDFIPPVGPLRVRVTLPKKPAAVTWEPEGRPIHGNWRDGVWEGQIDRVDIHGAVAIRS